jgi:hypothetical protein
MARTTTQNVTLNPESCVDRPWKRVSPSRYLLRWMEHEAGWELPPPHRVFVQPYTMPRAAREAVAAAVRRAAAAAADPQAAAGSVYDMDTNPMSVAPVPTPLPIGWGPSRPISEVGGLLRTMTRPMSNLRLLFRILRSYV